MKRFDTKTFHQGKGSRSIRLWISSKRTLWVVSTMIQYTHYIICSCISPCQDSVAQGHFLKSFTFVTHEYRWFLNGILCKCLVILHEYHQNTLSDVFFVYSFLWISSSPSWSCLTWLSILNLIYGKKYVSWRREIWFECLVLYGSVMWCILSDSSEDNIQTSTSPLVGFIFFYSIIAPFSVCT